MKDLLVTKLVKYVVLWLLDEFRRWARFFTGFLDVIKGHYFERKHNIKTDQAVLAGADRNFYKDGTTYQPTPYYLLEKIFNHLKPGPEEVFMDLGCGQGRVVFFAAARKLKKVIGVEMNKALVDIARQNLINFKSAKTEVEFVREEVINLQIKEGTIFFMFNPFGCKTLEKVLGNIKESLRESPRQIHLIYYAPVHRYLLDNENWLVLKKNIDDGQCLIWSNQRG